MKKILGILGGMGPQATADLLQKIIGLTAANSDQEHIHIYIDNYPQIPERISAILKGSVSPAPALQEGLDRLAALGAQCIVMPCVTAHYFLPQLRMPQQIQFINMLQTAAEAGVARYGKQRAALLATPATLRSDLLAKAMEKAGANYLLPLDREREELGELIYAVKSGEPLMDIVKRFNVMLEAMVGRGAHYFVLGCTELPLIAAQATVAPYHFVDPTIELAKAAVLACGYTLKSRD